MNELQYQEICEACDGVLRAPDTTIERTAIPWLHVIREHPMFLANYADLFAPSHGMRRIIRDGLQGLYRAAGWMRQLLRALRADGRPWLSDGQLPTQVDMLFISHLLNPSQAGKETDFYFGDLPSELAAQGYVVVIVLINQTGLPDRDFQNKWKRSAVPRVILADSLQIAGEIGLQRRLEAEARRLRIRAREESVGLAQRVLVRASREALSGASRKVLRMAQQMGALVSHVNPGSIMVTHEGHGWERVLFATARRVDPRVRCFGYQHAALFRLQHAVRRNLGDEYNPDHILTAGDVSRIQLESAPGLKGIPVSVLGSDRSFKSGAPGSADVMDHEFACLVLPEGFVSECNLLFEFSLACAHVCPEILFIWRLHPLVTYEGLARQNAKFRRLPSNIILSEETLEKDIKRSRWSLYRGTTAIIKAVGAGVHPLYLQLPNELTIDPLYELGKWRSIIANVHDFQIALWRDQTGQDKDLKQHLTLAQKYCASFFRPFRTDALTSLLTHNSSHSVSNKVYR